MRWMQQIRLLLVAVATLQENKHWLQLFQKLNWRTSFGASLFFHEMYQCTCRALYLLGLFFAQIDFSDLPGTVRQIIFMAPIELSSSMQDPNVSNKMPWTCQGITTLGPRGCWKWQTLGFANFGECKRGKRIPVSPNRTKEQLSTRPCVEEMLVALVSLALRKYLTIHHRLHQTIHHLHHLHHLRHRLHQTIHHSNHWILHCLHTNCLLHQDRCLVKILEEVAKRHHQVRHHHLHSCARPPSVLGQGFHPSCEMQQKFQRPTQDHPSMRPAIHRPCRPLQEPLPPAVVALLKVSVHPTQWSGLFAYSTNSVDLMRP